jgi:cell division protein FtsB
MGAEELQELHEHAEHAKHHPDAAPVSLTMAILAVLVATITLLGHRSHTEEVILQNKVSDGWAFYQAKTIRRHADQIAIDMASISATKGPEEIKKITDKYETEADRYKDDQKDLEAEAKKLQEEQDQVRRKADRFDLSEVFLEIALIVTSITLLSGKRAFWFLGMAMGVIGAAVAVSSLLVH